MANEQDYVDLGLSCADICTALGRGMDGKTLDDLGKLVCDAINQLTTWVEPTIHTTLVHSLTTLCIIGPLQKFKGRYQNEANAARSPDSSARGMTRT